MQYINDYLAKLNSKRFKIDKIQVSALLQQAAGDFERYRRQVVEDQQTIRALQEKLADVEAKNEHLQDVVLSSEALAKQIVTDANGEAQQIIDEARREAERLREELLCDTRHFRAELEQMRDRAAQAKEKLDQAFPQI